MRAVLRRLLARLDSVTHGMALASGAVFLAVSFFITLDVVGRKFFAISSAVTDEMGGYALAFGSMWALAWTLRTGGHVRIDVILPKLPPTLRRVLDYLAMAVMILFAVMVAIYCWTLAYESFDTDARAMSFLRTPIFVPQGLLALGLSVLAIEAVVILLVGIIESLAAGRLVDLAVGREEEIAVPLVGDRPLV
ncbi:MAG: TRAP transporter small permease [Candidatus Rokubacteria bacterium]|nr:TRAP transporter small permease [Candidatus Rokubacteria bacterium]